MFFISPPKIEFFFFFFLGISESKKKKLWYEKVNQGKCDVGDPFLVFPDLCFSRDIYVMDEKVGFR